MPSPGQSPARSRVRRSALLGLAFLASLLSCGREVTGPGAGLRFAENIAFVAQFPGPMASVASGAGSIVSFDRIRVVLRRTDGAIAIDRTVQFGAGTDSVVLDLRVPLEGNNSEGEPLALNLAYMNAAGDTVFRGGPVSVFAVPAGSGPAQPSAVPVPLTYTGPGAAATSVAITPETLTVVAGAPFAFTAVARDAQGASVTGAPILFTSLDTTRAPLAGLTSGSGTTRALRGTARIVAQLAAGGAPDTAVLVVTPRPASLALRSGGAQTATAGTRLSDSVKVRLVATDGAGIAGLPVAIAVTTGGGALSADTLLTNADGDVAFTWTLGTAVGAQSATARAAGVTDLVIAASASEPPLVATQLAVTQQPSAAQVVAQTLAPALRVEARDAAGVFVPAFSDSVTLAFGANPASATLSGTLRVAAVGGIATFPGVSVSAVGSGYTLVASATGLASATSAPFDVGSAGPALITLLSGGAQTGFVSQPLALPITVKVTDALGNASAGATVTFAVSTGGGTLSGAVVQTNATGEATLGGWTLGATPGANAITATVGGVTPLTITATGELPPPAIELSVVGSNVVGFERAGALNVRLLQPAPAGGLLVTLASASPAVLSIAAPGTVSFTAGQTVGKIDVSGLTIGTAAVSATAPGYAGDTLLVPVSLNLISLPPSLTVPLAQTRSLPVQLSANAPAGGVTVAITSSNTAVARPVADSVFIPAGSASANATISGDALGTATFTATNPNYAPDVSTITVAAELNFTATTVALNGSFGTATTIRLESAGSPVAAPTGGVPLTLVSRDATCATAPAAPSIGAGLVSTTVTVTYGGSAALPCTTRLVVTGPEGFVTDSIIANVAAVPGFTRAASTLGYGLQRNLGATLNATNHGGVVVKVTSLDSAIVRVGPTGTAAATGSFETTVLPNGNSIPLWIAGIPTGRTGDTVAVRIEAPGFATLTFNVFVWQPVFQLTGLVTTANTLSTLDAMYVSVGTPQTPTGTQIWNADDVRVGGGPIVATFVNDGVGVGTLVTSTQTGDSITVNIPEGASNTPTTVAAGGLAFRPLAAGSATIRTSVPNFRALATSTATVTVTQPTLSLPADYVGSGLQRLRTITTPSAPAPAGGTAVTITAARTGLVQFAPSATTVGSDTLVVTIPAGATSVNFYVQAADDIVQDSVLVTATAAGYTTSTTMQRVWRPVYNMAGLNTTGTPLTADDPFYVNIGTPSSPTGTQIWVADDRRFGAPPFEVSFINGNPATGTFVRTGPVLADSVMIPLVAGTSNTPTTVAAGGVAFRYLAAGTAIIRASIPGLRAVAGAVDTVTVSATSVNLSDDYLGSGLQRSRTVSLSAPAPVGGAPITIVTERPGVVLLAPNATTVGRDTLVVTIAAGATSATFTVQALEGFVNDSVTLTASSPGFSTAVALQRVWQGVADISGIVTNPNTLAIDDPFQVLLGTPSTAAGGSIWIADLRRFGADTVFATIASGTSTVAQLVTSARTGDTVTVPIVAGTRASPTTVALGGAAVQTLTTGSTVISATVPGFRSVLGAVGTTVTVSAPAITLNAVGTVGGGLQVAATGSLSAAQHGGVSVIIKSSNPALFRVAPNAATAATDSIIIPIGNGGTAISYVVAGEDGAVGQASVSARAVGFVDAVTTVTVAAPAIQLSGLVTNRSALGADDPFLVQVGIPAANLASLAAAQARRAGAAPLVITVSSSDPSVATLVNTAGTGDTLTVAIAAGASNSPTTVAANGIALRYLSAGTSTIRITHPTIATTTTNGVAAVTVTTPVVSLAALPVVGAGLQIAASGSVSSVLHGGLDVILRSSDPTRLRLARTATEVAADSIIISLANNVSAFTYVIAGVEGTTGAPTVTATAVGHTPATVTSSVVTPRLDINGLVASRAALGADDPFQVRIGIPNAGGTALASTQAVRFGVSPLQVTVTSSAPAVGTLVTTALTGGSVTVNIAPGQSASPSGAALGGVEFRYLTAGTSVVTATATNIPAATTNGVVTVTVTP